MKRKLLMALFIGISIFMISCSEKKSPEFSETPAPAAPDLEFNNWEQLIECLESRGEVGDDEHSNVNLDYYPFLLEALERKEILTIINEDGENILLPMAESSLWFVRAQGRPYNSIPDFTTLDFRGEINGEEVRVDMRYLSEEEYGMSMDEILTYRWEKLQISFHSYRSNYVGAIQLAVREVDGVIYEYDGYDIQEKGYVYFLYDDMVIRIERLDDFITDEFLSQITVGYIEID